MLPILAALLVTVPPHGTVRTDSLWSQALGVFKHYVVYLPPSYDTDPAHRYPVAYYLHGYDGSETDWVQHGHLDAAMDSLIAAGAPEMIVVMPDGDDSWYTTWDLLGDYRNCQRDTTRREPAASFCVPWPHYDDYIARDLVAHVDSMYRTEPDRRHRAIAGLSMGGYGALALALQYPGVWSAAASHSGVVSPMYLGPHPFSPPARFATSVAELRAPSGHLWPSLVKAFGRDLPGWRSRDPLVRLERLRERSPTLLPALFLDVGRDDPFADQSRALHAALDSLGVPSHYAEWPGTHDWAYWSAHVRDSLAWIDARIGR